MALFLHHSASLLSLYIVGAKRDKKANLITFFAVYSLVIKQD